MRVTATVNSKPGLLENIMQSDGETKTISIAPKINGGGSSIKGGELLLLSLATCYCNSIYREAGKRNLDISAVEVLFTGEFGTDSETGSNFQYKV